ncbi:N-acetylglucosamine-1-phosphotransferase subunits alpha/beta [Toxorhynchites rutilus septentrionalis]|uniref:N-acetylglucosamine-1-phosphotransferase subunits alpha/beta n=1 Tax=Toxorhynchites rutilus septentrionalis TaxID=329112 RepID=UPI0024789334|nr:N-acetylglucosamine-1-phosphotransferase subunits alpha/beta [Toxorhynchites rutilus septentrionalis]
MLPISSIAMKSCFISGLWRTFRIRCCFFIVLAVVTFLYLLTNLNTATEQCVKCYDTLDVVYTWVNGSDQLFLERLKLYSDSRDKARYDDKNELKYSLRSLEKYAPWVRKVYIVTNGQIPFWLNLDCPKIQLIQHSDIADEEAILPTFSSTAIETFIHRIPGLSKNFLYLNDDIFLGAPLYPDDLITLSEGVKVFTAWLVPDCAKDCPWMFVGDGSCDSHCYVEECQFDGGDCDHPDYRDHSHELVDYSMSTEGEDTFIEVPRTVTKGAMKTENVRSIYEIFHRSNRSTKQIVDKFNQDKLKSTKQKNTFGSNKERYSEGEKTMSNSQDIFARSLIHTNRIFNSAYGFKNRKVLAHVGFLLNIDIIESMLSKFRQEFALTKRHRFREKNDMQYAFTYYHFLMGESRNKTISEIFDDFDTDKSGTWSDREIRTLLAKIYNLPLDWSAVRYFEEVVTNCSLQQNNFLPLEHQPEQKMIYPTLVYERYEDSTIPTVTKKLVNECHELTDMMRTNFGQVPLYKFHINQKTGMYSNFKMLTSNITHVVDALDELRKNPKKFNCINDNLVENNPEENLLISALLEDFYLSLFPVSSQFELTHNYRNRFQYYDDYKAWLTRKMLFRNVVYGVCLLVFVICTKMLCFRHKGKFARTLAFLSNRDYNAI